MDQTPTRTATRPVPIGELLDAWLAVQRGDFRRNTASRRMQVADSTAASWSPEPGEVPIVVIGCGGGAGASTVALLLVETSGTGRVVECGSPSSGGLAGASTAELGEAGDGWLQGRRAGTLIQRRSDRPAGPSTVAAPLPGSPGALVVVDACWRLRSLLDGEGWLADLGRTCPRLVLVARCAVPGVVRLEADLSLVDADRCWAVITGVPRQLPRTVEHALGPRARDLRECGRLHLLPLDAGFAVAGITTEPLPRAFERAGQRLLKGLLP